MVDTEGGSEEQNLGVVGDKIGVVGDTMGLF